MPELDALLADLERLVNVESPSRDVAALQRSADNLAALIEERTGRPATLVDGPDGPHVHWRGGGPDVDGDVLILGHHDTVFPLGTLTERPFRVADGVVTGPGVFDMKGGIVQAIHAVAGLPDPLNDRVEMLFTSDEEVGSITSRELLEQRAVACGNVLVLEPSADGGAVKTGRKGCGTFEVIVRGRASHAGLDPEAGRNALIEVAHQVLRIAEFGDAAAGTTVSPTVAHVGTAENVIPDEGRVRVDVRVTQESEKARVEQLMATLTPVTPDVTIEVIGSVNRPPMPESASATLFPLVNQIAPDLGGVAVGGGSDGNFTAALGVPTLDGLGAVGGGAHAVTEHVLADTIAPRTALLHALLTSLLAR